MGEEEPLPPLAQGQVVSPVCPSLLKDSLTAGLPGPSFMPACVLHVGGALFLAQTQLFLPHGKFPCLWNFPSWLLPGNYFVKCHQGQETHLPPCHLVWVCLGQGASCRVRGLGKDQG